MRFAPGPPAWAKTKAESMATETRTRAPFGMPTIASSPSDSAWITKPYRVSRSAEAVDDAHPEQASDGAEAEVDDQRGHDRDQRCLVEQGGDDQRCAVGDGVVAEGREHGHAEGHDGADSVTRREEFGESAQRTA